MSTNFTCEFCQDELVNEVAVLVDTHPICSECFEGTMKPRFVAAQQYETDYPVKYPNGGILDIDDFASFFTPGFLAAFHAKSQEYAVPPEDRLYCKAAICERFLGRKSVQILAGNPAIVCSNCSTPENVVSTCVKCSNNFINDISNHTCAFKEEVDAYDGQIRGKDYQRCPREGCNMVVFLSMACNHMDCPTCNTAFCYICGEAIMLGGPGVVETHFQSGCPRTGQPNTREAIYDEGFVDNAEDTVPDTLDNIQDNDHGIAFLEIQQEHPRRYAQLAFDLIGRQRLVELAAQHRPTQHLPFPNLMEDPQPADRFAQLMVEARVGNHINSEEWSITPFLVAVKVHKSWLDVIRGDLQAHHYPLSGDGRARSFMLELVNLLATELPDIYTFHLRQEDSGYDEDLGVFLPAFQDLPGHVEAYRRILALDAILTDPDRPASPPDAILADRDRPASPPEPKFGYEFVDVEHILQTYLAVWNGDVGAVKDYDRRQMYREARRDYLPDEYDAEVRRLLVYLRREDAGNNVMLTPGSLRDNAKEIAWLEQLGARERGQHALEIIGRERLGELRNPNRILSFPGDVLAPSTSSFETLLQEVAIGYLADSLPQRRLIELFLSDKGQLNAARDYLQALPQAQPDLLEFINLVETELTDLFTLNIAREWASLREVYPVAFFQGLPGREEAYERILELFASIDRENGWVEAFEDDQGLILKETLDFRYMGVWNSPENPVIRFFPRF